MRSASSKSSAPPDLPACHRRIAELEARLREAEETLGAIRAGEVDALVIGDPGGPQRVYTLETADRPYRVLIQEIREGAVTLTHEGIVLYCNRALAGILRAPMERVIGVRFADFVARGSQVAMARLLSGGGRGDLELCTTDGQSVPVHLSLSQLPADGNGAPVFCGVVADLTEREARTRELADAYGQLSREVAERERTEARLHQAQKMEALGQLAGGVAHDFNNSAAVVLAGLALLEKRHRAALDAANPAIAQLLTGVREGAERGASVARRLLSFARREELLSADIDPAELLASLREVLTNALGHAVRVRVEAPAGLPALRADRPRLETTLINLAVNARDAMPDGGTVVLGAAAEDLSAERALHLGVAAGGYLRLWVTDTGTGMDAATLARATEPFFTSKPKGRGTGLGLSMADGFAVQSGGTLRIQSVVGKGTTVTLWLPRADAIGPATSKILAPVERPPRRRALVVDDSPMMRRFLRDCLDHEGWDTVDASNTEEALAVLQTSGAFDALIADLIMPPGPDGMALIREARARYPELPAILVSGSEALRFHVGLESEGIAVLRKPVSPQEFADLLKTLVEQGDG